jgi:hypothetical protein
MPDIAPLPHPRQGFCVDACGLHLRAIHRAKMFLSKSKSHRAVDPNNKSVRGHDKSVLRRGALFSALSENTNVNDRKYMKLIAYGYYRFKAVPRAELFSDDVRQGEHEAIGDCPMLSTILVVVLILLLIGALPTWGYSGSWGSRWNCRRFADRGDRACADRPNIAPDVNRD